MNILIKNSTIVNPDNTFKADFLLQNGKIVDISENIENTESVQTIDASGLYAFPGGIDPHVHMELPTPAGNSSDDFFTGSKAALAGGTTTVIDFVTPSRDQSLLEALQKRKQVAEKSLIDFTFHMGITSYNKNTASEIIRCIEEGITSFKVYLAYRNTIGIGYDDLKNIMQIIAKNRGTLAVHSEDGDEINRLQQDFLSKGQTAPLYHALSHPENVESDAVAEVLKRAEETGCATYVVHVSAKRSIELIAQHKSSGKIYAETCPQYLFLDETNYQKPLPDSLKYVISPPLRNKGSMNGLWQHIESGAIDVISTDHCPFDTFGQKDVGKYDFTKIPNGAGGIEYRLALLYTYGVLENKNSLSRFVELISTNAAKIFGLYPHKGLIAVGSDADIVLWNPNTESTISKQTQFQHCDSNIYEGIPVKGNAAYVICNGNIVFADGKHSVENQKGRFLKRKTKNPY